MQEIKITIKNKIAFCPMKYLVSSNSNYKLVFDFDSEWDNAALKTVRVLFGTTGIDLVMNGNSVELPRVPVCSRISVGVFTDSIASSVVEIGCLTSIADSDCSLSYEFTESQYDQIIAVLNSVDLRKITSVSRIDDEMLILYNDGTESRIPLYDGVSVSQANVNNNGELILEFTDGRTVNCGSVKGEPGPMAIFSVGQVEALGFDSEPYVNLGGTSANPVLDFGIPQGQPGPMANFSVGTVETLNSNVSAYVTLSGTAENPVLNFGIPKGERASGFNAHNIYKMDESALTFVNLRNSIQDGNIVYLSDNASPYPMYYFLKGAKLWGTGRNIVFGNTDVEFVIDQDANITERTVLKLPIVSQSDNGKILVVRNGEWTAQDPSTVFGN